MQGQPRLRVQSEKLQCARGFRLPVCKARTALPDSVTPVLPQNRVRLFFARGAGGAGAGPRGAAPLPAGGLPGRAGPRGGQSVSRSLPHGRVPEGRGKAGWRRRKRRGRRKALPAGLGRLAPRGKGRRRGRAASENREEGRILEAQDKQIVPLHVRGGGGGEGGERAPRPRLFPSPKPALCHRVPARAPGASPRRYGYYPRRRRPSPERARLSTAHHKGLRRRALRRRSRCGVPGKREAYRAPRFLPPGGHRTRRAALTPAAHGGEGAADTFPELPASPTPKGKYKNRREEIRERILLSGLGGGNCPFLPEKLSHWLLSLPRTHPPSHLSLSQLPATTHSSGLMRQA